MKEDKFLSSYMLHRLNVALVATNTMTKKDAKALIKKSKPITSSLIGRMENLSPKNPLAPNVQLAFPIIALWLSSNKTLSFEKIEKLIAEALNSSLIKFLYSFTDFNKEKDAKKFLCKMKKYAQWHDKHPEDSNGWKFGFDDNLHKEGCYYDFKFCPIADFCIKNGYKDIAPYLCSIDYTTFKLAHGKLIRNKTLAKGDDMCDFWIVGDQEKID